MDNDRMNAFYPGAGTDLAPPVLFPEIKTWYYMDSQPRSEYGDTVILYRPTFLDQLNQIMRQCGFERLAVTNNLYTYFSPSTEQTIYYETNTNFPDAWDPIKHTAVTLVLCGYDMESFTPFFFSSYSHIITNNITFEDVWKNNILPTHTLSRINYPKNKPEYEYWNIENETAENIRTFLTIEKDVKWNPPL